MTTLEIIRAMGFQVDEIKNKEHYPKYGFVFLNLDDDYEIYFDDKTPISEVVRQMLYKAYFEGGYNSVEAYQKEITEKMNESILIENNPFANRPSENRLSRAIESEENDY